MRIKGPVAALSLFTIFGSLDATAEPYSLADPSKMKGGSVSFTLHPPGPKDRIKLNKSLVKRHKARGARAIPTGAGPAESLKHLIGWAESRRDGYDAIQHGAKIRPAKRPTQMTITEIFQWIAATPGQQHAIGRYQFIPSTLKALVHEAGLSGGTMFSVQTQDRLADILIEDAGYSAFVSGRIGRHQFMENLARIWAGFPTSSGRSFYHGYAGNRSVIGWREFDAQMAMIFPN